MREDLWTRQNNTDLNNDTSKATNKSENDVRQRIEAISHSIRTVASPSCPFSHSCSTLTADSVPEKMATVSAFCERKTLYQLNYTGVSVYAYL